MVAGKIFLSRRDLCPDRKKHSQKDTPKSVSIGSSVSVIIGISMRKRLVGRIPFLISDSFPGVFLLFSEILVVKIISVFLGDEEIYETCSVVRFGVVWEFWNA